MIKTAAIVAMSENRVIGKDNDLPWHLPEDLHHFKSLTMGKPLIMGRRTFDSIGKPLPGRHFIVLTGQSGWRREGVEVASSVSQAVGMARKWASANEAKEIMVAGGAVLYRETLPLLDVLYLTLVHRKAEGDTFFPELDYVLWKEVKRSARFVSKKEGIEYSFLEIHRRVESRS